MKAFARAVPIVSVPFWQLMGRFGRKKRLRYDKLLIHGEVLQHLHEATRPANFNAIHDSFLSEAKEQPRVIATEIAGISAHFANVCFGAERQRNARADAIAIADSAEQGEPKPIVPSFIAQQFHVSV